MRVFRIAVAMVVGIGIVVPTIPAAADPVPQSVAPVTTEIALDLAAAAAAPTTAAPTTAAPAAAGRTEEGLTAAATAAQQLPQPAETGSATEPTGETPTPALPGTSTSVVTTTETPTPTGTGPAPVTIEHETDGTFSAIGFRFDAASAVPGIEVRVREDGTWTGWETVGLPDGGPDADSPEAAHAAAKAPNPTTEPLLTSRADSFQVRVTPTAGALPTGFTAVTVDPGTSPYDAVATPTSAAQGGLVGVTPSALGAADLQFPYPAPAMISRAQWGADESIRTSDPDCANPRYDSTVKVGFVHHTASTNNYDAAGAMAAIRATYAYDAQVLGWCDIAYNFLVDKWGRIFEGRYGGADRPVHGTHTGGFNTDTFAVAALGNYQEIPPSDELVNSIGLVVGWKLGMYNRPIYGQNTLVSAGGGTSRYAAGVAVTFNNVSGHRDPGATLCPGQYLYDRLGDVKSVATYVAEPHRHLGGSRLTG